MRVEASISKPPTPEPVSNPSARATPREVLRHPPGQPGGEGIVELVVPRVVGPGRLERGYRARIERLEGELAGTAEFERELELARLVERGAQRRLDRLETELGTAREAVGEARTLERRLCAAIGALQRENALLSEELQRRATARLAPPRRPLLARWFGRRK